MNGEASSLWVFLHTRLALLAFRASPITSTLIYSLENKMLQHTVCFVSSHFLLVHLPDLFFLLQG